MTVGPCAGVKRTRCRAWPSAGHAVRRRHLLLSRLAVSETISRRDAARAALVAVFHLAALVVMAQTEVGIVPKAIFLFTWGLLNFFWLAVLRRPAIAAALSLALIVALIRAFAVQARQAADDGQFRRLDDSRFRYDRVLPDHLSRSRAQSRHRGACRGAGSGAGLVARSVPGPAARRGGGKLALPGRRRGDFDRGADAAA